MRDRPSGADLLAEARRLLVEELAPTLAPEARYRALMIGNAMGMAQRELAAGTAPLEAAQRRLQALLGESGDLETLNRRLARAIREGARDGEPATYEAIRLGVLDRLRESNPRALPADGPRPDLSPSPRAPG